MVGSFSENGSAFARDVVRGRRGTFPPFLPACAEVAGPGPGFIVGHVDFIVIFAPNLRTFPGTSGFSCAFPLHDPLVSPRPPPAG